MLFSLDLLVQCSSQRRFSQYINALRACVYIYIRQLSSFRAPNYSAQAYEAGGRVLKWAPFVFRIIITRAGRRRVLKWAPFVFRIFILFIFFIFWGVDFRFAAPS